MGGTAAISLEGVLLLNLAILVGMIPLAVLLVWGILRGLDKLNGAAFRQALSRMNDDPKAVSLYYSARFAAVCYLVAALTSRFV